MFRAATWLAFFANYYLLLAVLNTPLSISIVLKVAVVSKVQVRSVLALFISMGANCTRILKMAYININRLGGRQDSLHGRCMGSIKYLNLSICLWMVSRCKRVVNVQYKMNVLKQLRGEAFHVFGK